jgi:hypothetical protein
VIYIGFILTFILTCNLRADRGGGKSNLAGLAIKGDGEVLHENVTEDHGDTILRLDTQAVLVSGVSIIVKIVQQILRSADGKGRGSLGGEGERGEVGDIAGGHGDTLTLEKRSSAVANTGQIDGVAHGGEALLEGLHDAVGDDQESGSRINDNLVGVELGGGDAERLTSDGNIGQVDAVVLLLGDSSPLVGTVGGNISTESNAGTVGDEAHGERGIQVVGLLEAVQDGGRSPRADGGISQTHQSVDGGGLEALNVGLLDGTKRSLSGETTPVDQVLSDETGNGRSITIGVSVTAVLAVVALLALEWRTLARNLLSRAALGDIVLQLTTASLAALTIDQQISGACRERKAQHRTVSGSASLESSINFSLAPSETCASGSETTTFIQIKQNLQ